MILLPKPFQNPYMKRIFAYIPSARTMNAVLLMLRLVFGGLMIPHGYDKLIHYSDKKSQFIAFLGIAPEINLALVIFAEFFCAILLVFGLLTRWVAVPLIITMAVALFVVNKGDVMGKGEIAMLYLTVYVCLLFTGGGRYSLDAALYKK